MLLGIGSFKLYCMVAHFLHARQRSSEHREELDHLASCVLGFFDFYGAQEKKRGEGVGSGSWSGGGRGQRKGLTDVWDQESVVILRPLDWGARDGNSLRVDFGDVRMIKTCVKRFRATAADLRAALGACPASSEPMFYEDKVGDLGGGERELHASSVRALAPKLGLVGRFMDLTELFAFRVASLEKAAAQRGSEPRSARGGRDAALSLGTSPVVLEVAAVEEDEPGEEEEEVENAEDVYYYDPLEDGEDASNDIQLNLS
jgi:hypothetical protein